MRFIATTCLPPKTCRYIRQCRTRSNAHALLHRDVDYLVKDGAIASVDEFKGRIVEDRRWPAGLHTAVEAKEGLALKKEGRVLGSITLENLIAFYPNVCGMTGTACRPGGRVPYHLRH